MHLAPGRLAHPLLAGLLPRMQADGSIAIGSDPVHGALLIGATMEETSRLFHLIVRLARLSGPVRADDLAAAADLPVHRVEELCDALEQAGLTRHQPLEVGDPDLTAWSVARRHAGGETSLTGPSPLPLGRRRSSARVVVDGSGSLVSEIARLLRAAGVGEVRSGWYAAAADDHDPGTADPAVVVCVGSRLPRDRARDWSRRGVVHLPVVTRPGSVDIGPLVVAGAGPCLRCVELTDAASRPAHVDDAEDLVADGQSGGPTTVEASLAAVVAGTVAMLVLGVTDAYPPPTGMRWHTALPLPSLATSRCSVHPSCAAPTHHRRRRTDPPARAGPPADSVQGGRLGM